MTTGPAPGREDRHAAIRRIRPVLTLGNLFAAVLTFFYFHYIDPVTMDPVGLPRAPELAFFVVGIAIILGAGSVISHRWLTPLTNPSTADPDLVRRRALLVPYMSAGLTMCGWALAGIVWGVVWQLVAGVFTAVRALRLMFGITVVAGSIATALVFFAIEHRWRAVLPAFFPEGDLSAARVARLPVRARLLAILFLVGVLPLSVLGMLAYRTAVSVLRANPTDAAAIVDSLSPVIVFIVAVGGLAATGLATFVARSVAEPLRDVERAMARVEAGDLGSRSPVTSNDEIGAVAEGFNRMLAGLRERDFVKETFGKYVTREIRDEILAGRVALEGEAVEVTLLFSDLRDFTPWVESTDPREVVRDLNAYFTEMEDAIRTHRGLVLQYIGDEIEAVFGAPVRTPDHAVMAVRAAIDMRDRLARWNAERERAGKKPLRHGIGVHTGTVLAGNIGSTERLSYALVGDAVNLASRIQDLTKSVGTDILVSGATRARLDGEVTAVELPATHVKGRSSEVTVYKIV